VGAGAQNWLRSSRAGAKAVREAGAFTFASRGGAGGVSIVQMLSEK
jgi:hypothetical protein